MNTKINNKIKLKHSTLVILATFFALFVKFVLSLITTENIGYTNFNYDYYTFLQHWIFELKTKPFISNVEFTSFCNYTSPYICFLRFVSLFDKKYHLIIIKLFSYLFDFLLAYMGYKITYLITNNKNKAILAYFIMLNMPTFLLNSSIMAQCDSIYTFFLLTALYFILQDKYKTSIIFYGIACSIKLQSIFMLPIYGILLAQKKYKIYDLLIIPLCFFILNLPEVILSKSFKPLLMYLTQMNTDSTFVSNTMNYLNVFSLIEQTLYAEELMFPQVIYLGLIIIVATVLYFMYRCSKITLTKEDILHICFFFGVFVVFFMPSMHERYYHFAIALLCMEIILKENKTLLILEFFNFLHCFRFGVINFTAFVPLIYECWIILETIILFSLFVFYYYKNIHLDLFKGNKSKILEYI